MIKKEKRQFTTAIANGDAVTSSTLRPDGWTGVEFLAARYSYEKINEYTKKYLMIFLSILMYIPHIHTQLPFFRLIRTGLRLFRNFFINYFFFFFMFLFSYSFSPSRMLAFFRFPLLYFSHLKKNIFFFEKDPCIFSILMILFKFK